MSFIDAMRRRYSVRTYDTRPVGRELLDTLTGSFSTCSTGPLGNRIRFAIIEAGEDESSTLRELGTYGMIRNARMFIAGAATRSESALVDFGYCMERVILQATGLGLGTCWLGGTFNRSAFGRRLAVGPNEIVPAVTPVGYAREKLTIRESALRFLIGSRNRRAFGELFFSGTPDIPLTPEAAGPYATPLECVRIAPSASNKQPWRIVKEPDRPVFHFCRKPNPTYSALFRHFRIQDLDWGIALCHFSLACEELGLPGTVRRLDHRPAVGDLEYVATWAEEK